MTLGTKQRKAPFSQPTSVSGVVSRDGLEPNERQDGFLPFATPASTDVTYLRQFVEQGGKAVQDYKARSYRHLSVKAGMHILDVGCGIGADLLPLARRVGNHGLVTGLDTDAERLREAGKVLGRRSNIVLVEGNAEEMPFVSGSFDRVRADRTFLHIPDLRKALTEVGRVLRSGGIFAAVEPDWGCLALYPASPSGGDDAHTWSLIVQAIQQRLAHPFIGRQLASLLQSDERTHWAEVQIEMKAYVLRSWQVADAVLQITQAAQALAQEEPSFAQEASAWLQTIDAAAERGEFFASLPLFFMSARKDGSR